MSKTDFFVKNFGNRHEAKKKIISIFLANLLAAVAIDFFFSQKNFLSGGSTGIGLLVQYMTGIPTGVTVFLLNIPIMIIGYKYLTRQFVNYAAISTIVLSIYLTLFHYLPNPFILKDDMLVAVVGGAINGTSMGTLFRFGTCSGGL
ncbi:MAG: YitT family protein, partial [Finegoldia magna]|nr:YitT family protein [Finegoldia magna]